MHRSVTIFLLLAFIACKQRNHSAASTQPGLVDTIIAPITSDLLPDSLRHQYIIDSFFAVQPKAVFITDEKGESTRKLIATAIDTSGVTKTPIIFTDTTLTTFDAEQSPLAERHIYKSERFTVEVANKHVNKFGAKDIIINGQPIRAGIELDTSLGYSESFYRFILMHNDCALMKFGNKEYLFLQGGIEKCTGNAWGVFYYILYDPEIKKAMLFSQFRIYFFAGYDKTTNSPTFLDMSGSQEYHFFCECFLTMGRVFKLGTGCKPKPVTDNAGKQLNFVAYSPNSADTLLLVEGNLPVGNHPH